MLLLTFIYAFGSLILMILFLYLTDIFVDVKFNIGSDEYAELIWTNLPFYCNMPLNTFVNFIYTIVGLYWLTKRSKTPNPYSYSYLFSWMTVIYSFIQLFRIIFQEHFLAILDQWYTLHMASCVFVWSLLLQSDSKNKYLLVKLLLIDLFLFFSYPILIYLNSFYGFELCLIFHILLTYPNIIRLHLHCQNGDDSCYRLYLIMMGTISSLGFIFFDLYEMELALFYPSIFGICSGHFLSRLSDTFQIHFILTFFTRIEDNKLKESFLKKNFKEEKN